MGRRGTTAAVIGLACLVAACGGGDEPPIIADPVGRGGDLLEGVPGECQLLEERGRMLHERLIDAIGPDPERGPLVVVETEGVTVVATTVYESPGVEGPAAAWLVRDGEPVAINEEAARISTTPESLIDSAGANPTASAMAEASDCSHVAADRSAEDPPEPEPAMRPDLMRIHPPTASPGERVALTFPEETMRGIAFQLDRRTDDGWETTYWMTSDGNGKEYATTVPADTEGFGTIDVGVGGPGPDHVTLPEDIEPGDYRICTANAGDDFCAPLTITEG